MVCVLDHLEKNHKLSCLNMKSAGVQAVNPDSHVLNKCAYIYIHIYVCFQSVLHSIPKERFNFMNNLTIH